MEIGIVGLGYVGSALYSKFSEKNQIHTYDISKVSNCKSLTEIVNKSEIIFICLPTPMKLNGECDTSLIYSTLKSINDLSKNSKFVIIKSTVTVGFTMKIQNECDKLSITFNPEFLRERSYEKDFKQQKYIILGGKHEDCLKVKEIYCNFFPNVDYIITDSNTAEMVKYTINNFLAMKVSFANEVFRFCEKLDINYHEMIKIAKNDIRLGTSHLDVPGPDGNFGFGGSCFPKDTSAFLFEMEKNDVISYVIKAIVERNNKIDRKDKDWKQLKGRAVVSDEN
jgi:nucleotide sugar dehydrogenase